MAKGTFTGSYRTHTMDGGQKFPAKGVPLGVPYGGGRFQGKPYYLGRNDDTVLEGLELFAQLDKWVEYGTIEPSAADAIKAVVNNGDDWLDLRGKHFVLLGATSAMGPLLPVSNQHQTTAAIYIYCDIYIYVSK